MKKLIVILALCLGSFTTASAESAPVCSAQHAGSVTCMANRMCECKHYHASLMKGTPEGYRWDCGITRPNCIDFNKVEEVKPYDGPQSVGEGSETKIKTEVNN